MTRHVVTQEEKNAIINFAKRIGMSPEIVTKLIHFETARTMSPSIGNSIQARGLFQFTNGTAKGLGYRDSLDLITKNPTYESQMNVAYKMYKPYLPFKSEYEFCMANFLPIGIHKDPNSLLKDVYPQGAKANPGIIRLSDYVRNVKNQDISKILYGSNAGNSGRTTFPVVVLTCVLAYFFLTVMPKGCKVEHSETTTTVITKANATIDSAKPYLPVHP